jgi:hypothetical protein
MTLAGARSNQFVMLHRDAGIIVTANYEEKTVGGTTNVRLTVAAKTSQSYAAPVKSR